MSIYVDKDFMNKNPPRDIKPSDGYKNFFHIGLYVQDPPATTLSGSLREKNRVKKKLGDD